MKSWLAALAMVVLLVAAARGADETPESRPTTVAATVPATEPAGPATVPGAGSATTPHATPAGGAHGETHAEPAGHAAGAGSSHGTAQGHGGSAHDDPWNHPVLPAAATWPGGFAVAILGMFLIAAFVGPVVRAMCPPEVPPAHSHDEPPGSSHHHGKSGTLNPEPDHGHASGHHH